MIWINEGKRLVAHGHWCEYTITRNLDGTCTVTVGGQPLAERPGWVSEAQALAEKVEAIR